ncbi:MAG: hypothetical protein FWE37_01375 [Spirochaetaceae bacterium]|nr:hypothetical protein [Spirochaetaceae bacterium]
MRKLRFVCLFLAWPLFALQLTPENIVFVPAHYYVGDSISLQFTLPVGEDILLSVQPYEMNERIVVEQIRVVQRATDTLVMVEFRVFAPGAGTISFDFGAVQTTAINYNVASLLGNNANQELHSAYLPLALNGTILLITLSVATLFLFPLIIYYGLRAAKKLMQTFINYWYSPFKELRKDIKQLLKAEELDNRQFYFTLLESYRNYLSKSSHVKEYRSATADEFAGLLKKSYNVKEINLIVKLYERGDLIKFGGLKISDKQRKEDIELVRNLAKNYERYKGKRNAIT